MQTCYLLLEATHNGAFEPIIRIDPIRLYRYATRWAYVVLATEFIFIAYILVFIVQTINRFVWTRMYNAKWEICA